MKFSVRAMALASSRSSALLPLGEHSPSPGQNQERGDPAADQRDGAEPDRAPAAGSAIARGRRRPGATPREQRRHLRLRQPRPPTLLGSLPIVSDQFATVTVVPREEIARSPAPRWAISCSASLASPVRACAGRVRAGRSSAASTSIASASSRTGSAPAAPQTWARTTSCRSTRCPPNASR